MLYPSAEIRWFSKDKQALWNIFNQSKANGLIEEESRSDFYLKTPLKNTGIKIRDGNHEIKVKSNEDEKTAIGVIQEWIKWSTQEKNHILKIIPEELLLEWLEVKKLRQKIVFEIFNDEVHSLENERCCEEGCSFEFTDIFIPEYNLSCYTLGLEAFSKRFNKTRNLKIAINHLDLRSQNFSGFLSMGYPGFLSNVLEG
jgi:hypothetical protein